MELENLGLNPGLATGKCVTLGKLLNLSEPQFLHVDSLPRPQGPQDQPLPPSPSGSTNAL